MEDPSYEQLLGDLPYLDGVMREILRLHPAVVMSNRVVSHTLLNLSDWKGY